MSADVDLLDPDLHASGRALDVLVDLPPVSWTRGRRGRGYWSITGHPELVHAARDVETFSSWWGTRPEVLRPDGALRPLHNLDPPAHAGVRGIAEETLATMPDVPALVRAEVDRFVARGGGDAVQGLAIPLASAIFAAWTGIDATEHVMEVHAAGAALLDTAPDDPLRNPHIDRARRASEAIATLFREALASAERGPLATIARALEGDEAVALAALLVEAGLPTVTDALASALADLVAHPHLAPETPRARALLVEELLRRASPIAQFARRARRATTLGDVAIAEGDQVVLWFVAANHDARVFPRPAELAADRMPNPHVAFGYGPHACLGARVARQATGALVERWRERVRGAEIVGAVRRRSSYLRGYERLDVEMEC